MTAKKVNYVIFHSPGTLFNESTVRPIESWDVKKAVEMASTVTERYGAKPFAFKFQTKLEYDDIVNDEGVTFQAESKTIETSGNYHLNGKVRTYDQVLEDNFEDEKILRSNMVSNRLWVVVETRNSYKKLQPLGEKDVVLDASGNQIASYEEYREYFETKTAERDAYEKERYG